MASSRLDDDDGRLARPRPSPYSWILPEAFARLFVFQLGQSGLKLHLGRRNSRLLDAVQGLHTELGATGCFWHR